MADTIQAGNLPRPSAVEIRAVDVVGQSNAGNFLFTRQPDTALRGRVFLFIYDAAPAAVADAIRRHYREHFAKTFTVKLPRTGEVVRVRHLSSPSIQWHSAAAASATVELEEALAHE